MDDVDADESLMDVAEAFSAAAGFDEGQVRSGDSSFSRPGVEDGFDRVHESCPVRAVGVEVPMRRAYYRKEFGDRAVTIIFQSEVPVREGLQRGLDLINGSIAVSEQGE